MSSFIINPFSFGGAPQSLIYAIDCGRPAGGVVAGWDQDAFATGGSTFGPTADVVDVSAPNTAPLAVYQTVRFGTFTYNITGLTPSDPCTVRLHFAACTGFGISAPGTTFDVSIEGVLELNDYDVFVEAGGNDIAIVEEFASTADGSGNLEIEFVTVATQSTVQGIEIYQ